MSTGQAADSTGDTLLPLELLHKCIGHPIWILMRNNKEYFGTLRGFDDFINLVLDKVTEVVINQDGEKKVSQMDSMLLSGHAVVSLIPGTTPETAGLSNIGPSSR